MKNQSLQLQFRLIKTKKKKKENNFLIDYLYNLKKKYTKTKMPCEVQTLEKLKTDFVYYLSLFFLFAFYNY